MRHAVATAVFGRWLRGEAAQEQFEDAIRFAGQAGVDPVHLEEQRVMRRALELAGTVD